MLYLVRMDINIPADVPPAAADAAKSAEKALSQALQCDGRWRHLWRVVGQYSNVSVFDVDSPGELHDILWNLPLFPFMTVAVTALTEHPSALSANP